MDYGFEYGNRTHTIKYFYFKNVDSVSDIFERVKNQSQILMIPSSLVKKNI